MKNIGQVIRVHAPATVANLVCGFDIMGLCLEEPYDEMEIRLTDNQKVFITNASEYGLPTEPHLNTAGAPLTEIIKNTGLHIGFEITIHKKIKPGSGIGSSAASAAGAVVGANALLGNIFTKQEMVQYAMHGEKIASGVMHADNIAPCIYGGVTLIRSNEPLDIIPLPDCELFVTIVHPQIEVKTSDARKILKQEISLKNAIVQWGNVGGLVAGFFTNDIQLIGRSLQDVIVEPIRSILIPKFEEIKLKCKEEGAIGGGISGSGPSIFMLSSDEQTATNIETSIKNIYDKIGLPYYTYVTKINKTGVKAFE